MTERAGKVREVDRSQLKTVVGGHSLAVPVLTLVTSLWFLVLKLQMAPILLPQREYDPISWLYGARPPLVNFLLTFAGVFPKYTSFLS